MGRIQGGGRKRTSCTTEPSTQSLLQCALEVKLDGCIISESASNGMDATHLRISSLNETLDKPCHTEKPSKDDDSLDNEQTSPPLESFFIQSFYFLLVVIMISSSLSKQVLRSLRV